MQKTSKNFVRRRRQEFAFFKNQTRKFKWRSENANSSSWWQTFWYVQFCSFGTNSEKCRRQIPAWSSASGIAVLFGAEEAATDPNLVPAGGIAVLFGAEDGSDRSRLRAQCAQRYSTYVPPLFTMFSSTVYLCLRCLPLFTVISFVFDVYLFLWCLPLFTVFTFVCGVYLCLWCLPLFTVSTVNNGKHCKQGQTPSTKVNTVNKGKNRKQR